MTSSNPDNPTGYPDRHDSPYFPDLQDYALSLPGATLALQWNAYVYKISDKMFAIYSDETPLRITLKPRKDNLDAYLYHPDIEIAAYVGRFGWVTITVHDDDTAALAESLVHESFTVISMKKKRKHRQKKR